MVNHIVVGGRSQCPLFAQACLVADYLQQNLPEFKYVRIEKTATEYMPWITKVNRKNNWHHFTSPIVWKEVYIDGSAPTYIGGATDFWEYCYSYYNFDKYLPKAKFEELFSNMTQLKKRMKQIPTFHKCLAYAETADENITKKSINITISGATHPLVPYLISGLLDYAKGENYVSKIYLYGCECGDYHYERDSNFVDTRNPVKVVKYVSRLGIALTNSELLIIMNHIKMDPDESSIGEWLIANKKEMANLAQMINGSASSSLRILFPNLGPACFNATVLIGAITNDCKKNVVVATSNLGMEIAQVAAEIAEVPMRNMYCPPVWGFVGINHLVDINTTYHRYDTLKPYPRYAKVKRSTLIVGTLTPEIRTMQYLMHFDTTLWNKVAERHKKKNEKITSLAKAEAVVNVIKLWFLEPDPDNIINLGVMCDGSFGLDINAVFSQPCRLIDGKWWPAQEHPLPRDKEMKLPYLQFIAHTILKAHQKGSLQSMFPNEANSF